jgi:hypothetical protein
MSHDDEQAALGGVCEHLSERYPAVPEAEIRALVMEIYETFDGPIRDFVPVLVERAARARLADWKPAPAAAPTALPDLGALAPPPHPAAPTMPSAVSAV